MRILVTSANNVTARGYGAILSFNEAGELLGHFSDDPRIIDPRGLSLDPTGELIYVNSGDDRVLALDHRGRVVYSSHRIPGLDLGGGTFGPDALYHVGARRRATILAMPATLDADPQPLLPDHVVPFPRGFGFAHDGRLYLGSGIGPSAEGDNTIVTFDPRERPRPRRLVTDPELSPLDLTLASNGHVVVSSESPFNAADALASIREYDPITGELLRVLVPEPSLKLRKPRGLRFTSDGRLYCVGEEHIVATDFSTGDFLQPIAHLPRLNGQAIVLLDDKSSSSSRSTTTRRCR
jgi:hypothetical protein